MLYKFNYTIEISIFYKIFNNKNFLLKLLKYITLKTHKNLKFSDFILNIIISRKFLPEKK